MVDGAAPLGFDGQFKSITAIIMGVLGVGGAAKRRRFRFAATVSIRIRVDTFGIQCTGTLPAGKHAAIRLGWCHDTFSGIQCPTASTVPARKHVVTFFGWHSRVGTQCTSTLVVDTECTNARSPSRCSVMGRSERSWR
mgnify:CR=1 FL=1